MSAVIKVNPSLPAVLARLVAAGGAEVSNELTGGVTSGFPVISYRGKVWRIRKGGNEDNVLNDEGEAVPSIEVILLKSNPQPSKIYYEAAYEEGGSDTPTCWSADGLKPDAGVQKPVCKTCAACPNNVWGSKITPSGSKTKKCSDARRMAVLSKDELEEKGADAPLYLLRVPPASLNPLKDYAEKVLKPKAIPYFAVVTRIGFDPQSSYPKMTFKPLRFLNEEEATAVLKLRDSEDVRRILAESAEYDAAGTSPESEASPDGEEATPGTPAASTTKKKAPKPRPAEEEDVGLGGEEEAAPTPPPKKKAPAPAPVVEDDEEEIAAPPPPKKKAPAPAPVAADDDDEEAPPPPPVKKKPAPAPAPVVEDDEEEIAAPPPPKKKAAPAPAPVVEDDDEEAAPPPPPKKKKAAPAASPAADGGDFDSMLASILGPSS
jgi:hypothetical protein